VPSGPSNVGLVGILAGAYTRSSTFQLNLSLFPLTTRGVSHKKRSRAEKWTSVSPWILDTSTNLFSTVATTGAAMNGNYKYEDAAAWAYTRPFISST